MAVDRVNHLQLNYPPPTRGKVVVWGALAADPYGGMTWQVLHHLAGLRSLGLDVWYVEDSAHPVFRPGTWDLIFGGPDEYEDTLEFIQCQLGPIGLSDRWVFRPLGIGRCFGALDVGGLDRLYAEADVVFNLCGSHKLRAEHDRIQCLAYLQTDPVALQIEIAEGDETSIEELDRHQYLFTYGENFGAPDCLVPVERYTWHSTRPPVCVDWWESTNLPHNGTLTTVANWQNASTKNISWKGQTYFWQKSWEFEKLIDLPRASAYPLELALVNLDGEGREKMEAHGWKITEADSLSDPEVYRDYICRSAGEFSVAKDQYKRFRSGWFSDRSACYLAAGRPVITQDTAFGNILPTGEGLFAFSDLKDAAEAIQEVSLDYHRHARAAREIARDYFEAEKVLGRIVSTIGLD